MSKTPRRATLPAAALACVLHPVLLSIAAGVRVAGAQPGQGWSSFAEAFAHSADALAIALWPPAWPALAAAGVAPLPAEAAAFLVVAALWSAALVPSLAMLRAPVAVAALASLAAWALSADVGGGGTAAALLLAIAVAAITAAVTSVVARADSRFAFAPAVAAGAASLALLPSWSGSAGMLGAAGQERGAGARPASIEPAGVETAPVALARASDAAARGDGDAELAALRRALALAPCDAAVRRALGLAYSARGHWDEAARHLEKAVAASFSSDAALRVAAAEASARTGRPLRARALLERGVERDPASLPLRTALADFQREYGDHAAALANLEEAVRLHPDDQEPWRDLARLHAASRRWKDAGECWRRVVALAPRDATALAGLARALAGEGDADAARTMYRRSLDEDPGRPAVQLELARLVAAGRPDEAAALYAELRAALPPSPRLAYEHGVVLAAAGRDAEAVAAFRVALAAEPSHADAALELAWLLATSPEAGDAGEALRWARRAAAARPDDPATLDTLAAAEAAAGDFPAAEHNAERAIRSGAGYGDENWIAEVRSRLDGYRERRPHRRATAEQQAGGHDSPGSPGNPAPGNAAETGISR